MTIAIPDQEEFLNLSSQAIYDLVYPKQLSISVLLNGTRRWYVSQYFDKPPTDSSYLPHYLQTILERCASLLTMLADHGLHRIFVPVYSEGQERREAVAYQYLMRGIEALTKYPRLLETYEKSQIAVRFYGDSSYLDGQMDTSLLRPISPSSGDPKHYLYYDVSTGNPYNHVLKLAYEYSLTHGRPPTWEDMLELYYGDRTMRKLDILIAFNRIYSRIGLPHLLEGNDRIYLTVVTPLVMTQTALRRILYDFLFNHQDPSRNYVNIHPDEITRLKRFYAANQETIVGLTKKFDDLCYPLPGPTWPEEMKVD